MRDPEADTEQFERLMRAVLGGGEAGSLQLESEPFLGLRSTDDTWSHLFSTGVTEVAALKARVAAATAPA